MRFFHVTDKKPQRSEVQNIVERCSEFVEASRGLPLIKNLPISYNDIHRVKERKRKQRPYDTQEFAETFNEAFQDRFSGLRQRAVFANSVETFEETDDHTLEPFFILPPNGFRFLYSKEVENSSEDYKAVFTSIFEEFGFEKGGDLITDLLKFTYTSEDLYEGMSSGSEIILYNIPCFYAFRCATFSDYGDLIND